MKFSTTRSRRLGSALACASAVLALAACDVRLPLDDEPPPGGNYSTFTDVGSADVVVSVASRDGGVLTAGDGQGGSAHSVRFPTHDPSTNAPRAGIKIDGAAGGADELNPGTEKFSFGADVWLDAGPTSSSASGSTDNGDNVIQRGLFDGQSQWKIQVDNRRPMCRIKGSEGAVEVTSDLIDPETWYRLLCTRDGDVVTLKVTTWDESNQPVTVTTSASGATGDMTPASAVVPLSVGAKLKDDGTGVVKSADQFNGRIDNPHLDIDA